eukprot:TRINITY_DN23098_c0_g1_i1.p2 TRINITY_DN23098_c0_g1~~TRINITY_DN23098_c0_g1_i1.p2  ORF type:complete len:117 (-),score=38.05 TRINITY_DN23098_c0_g1_i1:817-1167(-)
MSMMNSPLRQLVRQAAQAQRRVGATRMLSSGGILNEEEKAAENVFIKKQEREKAEFLRKLKEGKTIEAAEAAAKAASAFVEGTAKSEATTAAASSVTPYLVGTAGGFLLGYFFFAK